MQSTLQELTDKLLGALDQDNNVVDMQIVLEVVSLLEDFPITKETLGQTRIGKYVNEMRRKTNDKDLARRAKNLVRRWKQFVDSAGSAPTTINGEGIAARASSGGPPGSCYPSGGPLGPSLSVGGSRPASPTSGPATPSSGKSTHSPSLPSRSRPDTPSAGSRPATPLSGHVHSPGMQLARPNTPGCVESPLARVKPPSTSAQPISRPGVPHGPSRLSEVPLASSTPVQLPPVACTPGTNESLAKTNASNKKRRRDGALNSAPTKRLQLCADSPSTADGRVNWPKNGIVPRLASGQVSELASDCWDSPEQAASRAASLGMRDVDRTRDRTPATVRKAKVKTTAELIQDMKASGDLQLTSSEMSAKIALNQIEKEEDPVTVSVVPASAKPRPRRKPGTVVPPSEKSLRQTKTEMVEKFLENAYTPIPGGDQSGPSTPSPLKSDPPSRTESPANLDLLPPSNNNNGSVITSGESSGSHLEVDTPFFTDDNELATSGRTAERVSVINHTHEDLKALLPPLLPQDELDWSEPVYEPPEHVVNDALVDRLHTDEWAGVNGQYDHRQKWHNWTQSHSVPSCNGEMLHILPYVDIMD